KLTATSGNNQAANPSTTFANPLVVTVTSAFGEPVAGGMVVYSPPSFGASAVLAGNPAAIGATGPSSVSATANSSPGTDAVGAGIPSPGANTVGFELQNYMPSPIVVGTLLDKNDPSHGPTSLREAIASAGPGAEITFMPGLSGTIVLALGPLNITRSVTITGPGASVLTISGDDTSRILNGA